MSEPSVHDNNVYAYAVLCDRREIILHTEFKNGSDAEYTDVLFWGVAAHYFRDVLAGNIVFGIEEVEVPVIIKDWHTLFSERKNHGWPDAIRYTGHDELIRVLQQRGIKAFEISSSYGLEGWVLAQKMELRVRAARAEACRIENPLT